ncbi:MAG: hypothetical protein M1544_01470 [Candidatus Marsarchaeota archaeon]|nr:hypothetical protein [Candidatus Marsarchaeota archaeon]
MQKIKGLSIRRGFAFQCLVYIIAIPVVSVALFGSKGILITILSCGSFSAFFMLDYRIARSYERMKDKFWFLELAAAMELMHISGKTFRASMSNAIEALRVSGNRFALLLERIPALMKYSDFGNAVKTVMASGKIGMSATQASMLSDIAAKYDSGSDPGKSIIACRNSVSSEISYSLNGLVERIQRYSTLEMLFGTILPSFALFGLAGYSILEPGADVAPLAYGLFAVVIPLSYFIVNRYSSVLHYAMY